MNEHRTIEQPRPTDFPALADLWEASVRATHDFLTEEDILFFKPLILEQYLKAVRLYCSKNAQGTITGFIGVAEHKVEMLFITPGVRGKGIGKALLHFAINELQATAVDVNEQNIQAVGFYLHEGFEVVERSATDSMGKPFPVLHLSLPTTAKDTCL